jgi:hypothetical protein
MGIEAIMAILGLVAPPVIDFVKQKFFKGSGDPESTIATLATTKPDQLGPYVEATSKYLDAQVRFFNRDITGVISIWVSNIRAIIRPLGVIVSLAFLFADGFKYIELTPEVRGTFSMICTSWFGSRISSKG